jgi:hypothetical protein
MYDTLCDLQNDYPLANGFWIRHLGGGVSRVGIPHKMKVLWFSTEGDAMGSTDTPLDGEWGFFNN